MKEFTKMGNLLIPIYKNHKRKKNSITEKQGKFVLPLICGSPYSKQDTKEYTYSLWALIPLQWTYPIEWIASTHVDMSVSP